ncbi:unnamed protein product, partial [Amoebophrya sp. A25]|eukprot:GSA25T00005800001.1
MNPYNSKPVCVTRLDRPADVLAPSCSGTSSRFVVGGRHALQLVRLTQTGAHALTEDDSSRDMSLFCSFASSRSHSQESQVGRGLSKTSSSTGQFLDELSRDQMRTRASTMCSTSGSSYNSLSGTTPPGASIAAAAVVEVPRVSTAYGGFRSVTSMDHAGLRSGSPPEHYTYHGAGTSQQGLASLAAASRPRGLYRTESFQRKIQEGR